MEGLHCLKCGNPLLDQDFGIVACTKCGTVMMLDWDGKLQLADPNEQERRLDADSDVGPGSAPEADLEKTQFYQRPIETSSEPESASPSGYEPGGFEGFQLENPPSEGATPLEDPPEPPEGFGNDSASEPGVYDGGDFGAEPGAGSHAGFQAADASHEDFHSGDHAGEADSSGGSAAETPEIYGHEESSALVPAEVGDGSLEPLILEAEGTPTSAVETEPAAEAGPQDLDANWFDDPVGGTTSPAPSPTAAETFSEIAEFGNQDTDSGALRFQLTIAEIDRGDLRQEVMTALSDPRLNLNAKDLAKEIKNGVLTLPGLSAARSSLLVSRLQHVDVRLRWKQVLFEA